MHYSERPPPRDVDRAFARQHANTHLRFSVAVPERKNHKKPLDFLLTWYRRFLETPYPIYERNGLHPVSLHKSSGFTLRTSSNPSTCKLLDTSA